MSCRTRDGYPYLLAVAGLALEPVGGPEGECRRERLGGHEVAVRLHGRDHLRARVDGQRDAVADVEPGLAAGLLDDADDVAGEPFGGELRRDQGVEDDDALAQRRRAV